MQRKDERQPHRHDQSEQEQEESGSATDGSGSEVGADADAVLDDIDDLLNEIEQPEEFVRQFVQKGGE
ncbi:ubiquitin-like protein Pup [Streptomyces sp. NPDC005483]|uniref:ubiquitin-like protein Pup n=1 Tax=Streptomyces sp. NPDC005483 TaxID=3154882 RepID=UPI0033AC09FD